MVIEAGLRGAFMLARGRPEGLMLVEETPAGAARSFWAAALCLPGFLALRLLAWAGTGGPAAGAAQGLAAELVGFACGWAGFALASLKLAEAAGRRAEWPHFLAAWNWSSVVQYLVMLGLTVPAALGLPASLANGLGLAAIGYVLWLEWFVARHALRLGGLKATVFVLLDLALSILIGGVVGRTGGG